VHDDFAAFEMLLDQSCQRLSQSFPVDPVLLGDRDEVATDENTAVQGKPKSFFAKGEVAESFADLKSAGVVVRSDLSRNGGFAGSGSFRRG